MAKRQRRVRQASRPKRAKQRRAPLLVAQTHSIEAKMDRQRPQQRVHPLFLYVQRAPGPLVERGELAQTQRSADRANFKPPFEGGMPRRTQPRRFRRARWALAFTSGSSALDCRSASRQNLRDCLSDGRDDGARDETVASIASSFLSAAIVDPAAPPDLRRRRFHAST